MLSYSEFLNEKSHSGVMNGFDPIFIPDSLFDFQKLLVQWAVMKGRAAIFADCGMGKTLMQLVWAENVHRKTNKPVMILTPLAVSYQTAEEAEKFGIKVFRTQDGKIKNGINITNYERLEKFDRNDFIGCVCDESSILKNFDGKRKSQITHFMKKLPYRLLCTATAAPNDYTELGTSAEALGELGYMDMLTKFFKNEQNVIKPMIYRHRGKSFAQLDEGSKWRLKGHAALPFWRWVSSWARAIRKPSDFNYSDEKFILPKLIENEHIVFSEKKPEGMLFSLPAIGLKEQRDERRRTIEERCEKVASIVSKNKESSLVWCHLNQEGDLLEKLIPDSIQVSGKDSDDAKEEKFISFSKNKTKVLVTKPKIGAWGLNFQHCSHITFFPSHSFEQYYQGVRRCWRFGQKKNVIVDVVATEGERNVLKNMQRKAQAADKMFEMLIQQMNHSISVDKNYSFTKKEELPSWI